jgi:monooxygenase
MSSEHFDVLIVGAGLSGIGAGCHLRMRCPGKSFAILEARERSGGTWDLFRYPGIRSDSDMYTLGYSFRPWKAAKAIADAPDILDYIRGTARDYGVEERIRYRHRVTRVAWSSADARWTIEVQRGESGEPARYTCNFLYMCAGYYSYESGYLPEFAGTDRFRGRIVHPQKWTGDVDYAGKRVVVIGSGATAVTLVPAMAQQAAHVTMLQRSPSYVMSLPARDVIADVLRKILPARLAYSIVRWKNVLLTMLIFRLSRSAPGFVRRLVRKGIRAELGDSYDMRHFTPSYNPWDQRMCLVPDADLFKVIREGRASIVTDHIDSFTEKGIRLKSGAELEADLIVTATGLNLQMMGGATMAVDGRPVQLKEHMVYRGMMLSDVPNMAFAVGYTNASWTLKVDLVSKYVCRLINHMEKHGYRQCVPRVHGDVGEIPLIDFSSGYVQRSLKDLPRQGARSPWRLYQNYALDILTLRFGSMNDGAREFSNGEPAAAAETPA